VRRSIKTKTSDIVQYWEVNTSECGLGVDFAEAHERCWRCGYKLPLERCHIIPASLGGEDIPSNYVLLCSQCHREAPNVTDPEFMWIWIRSTCLPFYDTYWHWRAQQEFQLIFGRRPFEGLDISKFDKDTIHN
jgi:hypothetical protein